MCMEDINIGRRSGCQVRIITLLANVPAPICTNAPDRIHIAIGCDTTNNFWVGTDPAIAQNNGLLFPFRGDIRQFDVKDAGRFVTGTIYGITNAASVTFAVLEVYGAD